MKPDPKTEASRWLKQAEHALSVARKLLTDSYFSDCCFNAEQAGQLALKAFLYSQGERFVTIHSVKELAECCAAYDAAFKRVEDAGRVLDHYYIPTRYPDALAFPALPYESYTEREAKEAVEFASMMIELVQQTLSR